MQWFAKLSLSLIDFGFVQSKSDYSLFTKIANDSMLIFLIYADDLIIVGNAKDDISNLKAYLNNTFHMKDLGNLH